MSDLLASMAASSRARCDAARAAISEDAVIDAALARTPPRLQLSGRFDIIAEIKRRAPSAGALTVDDIGARAKLYEAAGACAISVLTEPSRFDGDLAHLAEAAEAVSIPVMRKDFLVDPYQIWEARAHGAGGVLLIVRMVDDDTFFELLATARAAELFTLIECFDVDDLRRIDDLTLIHDRELVGINCRDLRTLQVVPDRFANLAPLLPHGIAGVAESGMLAPAVTQAVAAMGYRVGLVGTALMQAPDPAALLRAMLQAAR